MYDYRKDIIDIIKGTNPSIKGIEAVQSIVNLLRHQVGYQNPMSSGLPSESERNEETIEPLETSSPSDTAIEQNEASEAVEDIQETEMADNDESTQNEQDEAPVSDMNETAENPAEKRDALTLAQYDAIHIFKSIMETTANELRRVVKDSEYQPSFGTLKKNLEDCHYNLGDEDTPLTNAYYLIASQQLKQARQTYQDMLVGKENISQLIERLIATGIDLAKKADDASKLTAFQEAVAEARMNGLIKEETVQRFDALLKEQPSAAEKQTVEPAEGSKAADTVNVDNEPVEESAENEADTEQVSPTRSEPETEPSFAELLDQSSVFDLDPGEYVVQRRLTGAQLLDAYGQQAFFISEKMIRMLNLQDGDIVTADGEPYQSLSKAYIKRVTGHLDLDYDPIEVFRQAVVENKDGELVVTHNIYGKRLKVNGSKVTYHVKDDRIQFMVQEGDIVDLAWYANDDNAQDSMTIRWVYPLEDDNQPVEKAPKQKSAEKKPAKKEKMHLALGLSKQIFGSMQQGAQDAKKLKVDLKGQKVGIAIGNGQNGEILKATVKACNGDPRLINAFAGKSKKIEKAVKNLDMVIMIKSYANHPSSWSLAKACKKYGVKFAVSNKMSTQSFCRALYRAENNLPSDEQSGQEIEYPMG
ncbi:DUF2325 domain-containing protein [Limosilactobacillus mucosae]|uniref:DUF2325 domain-containing protein n=1 Tax=Limosilactobacillus mucosae TaxID=97478 RepID=UPI0022E21FA6|nr:DUF2325 domain-containing protein [Limosilactobacillus mucosae]